jgi:hypothetical protein
LTARRRPNRSATSLSRTRLAAKSKTRRRREAAEQAAGSQFLQPRLPGIGGGADPLENLGEFPRNHRLAFAEQTPAVIHQAFERVTDGSIKLARAIVTCGISLVLAWLHRRC